MRIALQFAKRTKQYICYEVVRGGVGKVYLTPEEVQKMSGMPGAPQILEATIAVALVPVAA